MIGQMDEGAIGHMKEEETDGPRQAFGLGHKVRSCQTVGLPHQSEPHPICQMGPIHHSFVCPMPLNVSPMFVEYPTL